jgi:tetrahydromethanopterin S-methyltransferase subunit F
VDGADPHPEERCSPERVRAQRDLVIKITSARESKGGEVNRGIIGVIIGVLVIIILVIVILQLT